MFPGRKHKKKKKQIRASELRSGLMGSMMSGMATGTGFSLGNRAAEAVFGPRQAEATWRAALVGEGFELLEGTGEKRKAVPAVPDLHLK